MICFRDVICREGREGFTGVDMWINSKDREVSLPLKLLTTVFQAVVIAILDSSTLELTRELQVVQ